MEYYRGTFTASNFPFPVLGEHAHAGGREFYSGRTNTKGLKITEEKVLPL